MKRRIEKNNFEDLTEKLSSIKVPEIILEKHKSELKLNLLNFMFNRRRNSTLLLKVNPILKKLVPIFFIGLTVIVAIFFYLNINFSNSKLYARELVIKAEQRLNSNKTFIVDFEKFRESLKEAKEAKDLEYLGDKLLNDQKRIKVIKYTDKDGNLVILGIDENNLPYVKLIKIMNKELIDLDDLVIYSSTETIYPDVLSNMHIDDLYKFWTENLIKP